MAENLADLQKRLDSEREAATRHTASSIPILVTTKIGEVTLVSTSPPAYTVGGASGSRDGAPPPNPPPNYGGG
eukprot:6380783-Heterocapsa_arctica.AAC.1